MSTSKITSSLRSIIQIKQSGLRSVNVEQDISSKTILEGYVLTAQARSSLSRMLDRFEGNTASRSWTLTGPYGSGKSFFGLFLMNLMGKSQFAHQKVMKQIRSIDAPLSDQVKHVLNHGSTEGLLPVPISGYRASLQECLKHGLKQSLKHFEKDGQIKPLLHELDNWTSETESRAIIRWIKLLIEKISQKKYGYLGMLLVFDEMGKPLEFASAHPDQTDIYLLQELAEFANRSGDTPFVFVGILHQAFEHYATFLDLKTQREWSKVQGRFEDIAFQEPPAQQMHLLINAIDHQNPNILKKLIPTLKANALDSSKSGWRPPTMKNSEFVELVQQAYPFHPTSLVAMPYFFRRLAQNERSMFAYLASHEPAGFQEFLDSNQIGVFLRLPELFDYLSINFQGRLYTSGRGRAITEAMERLSSATNLTTLEIRILKTIGMLNWLTENSHLEANESCILSAMRAPDCNDRNIRKALENLQSRSLIVYRRYNRTYNIWQGSDVDIEDRLQQAQQQLSGAFSLAEAVQKYLSPRPVVARRHSFVKGTLRYFEVRYVDSYIRDQVTLEPAAGASGLVFLCLPANPSENKGFTQWAKSDLISGREDIVVGIAEHTSRLSELLHELRLLHWVKEHTPELRDDSVARRELRTRINAIETLIQNDLDRTLSPYRLSQAKGCTWLVNGKQIKGRSEAGLSQMLSEICDRVYSESPIVRNEIINRRSLSSQGAAARRNLLQAMFDHPASANLDIEGFPPERSIYESMLKASGLHREIKKGHWDFSAPAKNDPLGLMPAWREMTQFIFNDTFEPHGVDELFRILNAPPYGLTDGVLPVLLCVFLIIHQNETTLYREGSLLPEPTIADWEVLLRRPELFSVAGCKITGTRQIIIDRFARGYQTEPAVMPVVRTLIRGLKTLPEHTWRTNRISKHAQDIRSAVDQAKSPERLLFSDLPLALELEPFDDKRLDKAQVEKFFLRLNSALTELSNETPRLLEWGRDEWLTACGLDNGEDGWSMFRTMAVDLTPHVTHPNLLPLLKRAAEAEDGRAALESVLAYIANRPYKSWTDTDTDTFTSKVPVFAKAFRTARDGYVPEASLSHEQRKHSRAIAENLRQQLKKAKTDDPQVLRVALQILLQELTEKIETKL